MIQPSRLRVLADLPTDPTAPYVLYWMQAAQRAHFNHALEHAATLANQLKKPLLVCFGLMDDYPDANQRHYAFVLEGFAQLAPLLQARRIKFVVNHGPAPEVALHHAKSAAVVVCDRNYLRHHIAWRAHVAAHAKKRVVQVESEVVVPVETASPKHEYAARTLRPKIHKLYQDYLAPLPPVPLNHSALALKLAPNPRFPELDPLTPSVTLAKLKLDRSVSLVSHYSSGETAARTRLAAFVQTSLATYAEGRNEPAAGATSHMSPYLHFGQISPIEIALAAQAAATPTPDRDAYIEELIVRRELAMNHAFYNPRYDQFAGLPDWARKTLTAHANDPRPHTYTLPQLEAAETRDPYWNAAQMEMTRTGFMHNYMRMYWGKKILEWSPTPELGFQWNLHLNNKYFLDGRDANSFTGVGWVYGLHDRPWGPERPIFGLIRYMNAAGLERKFDIDAYVKKVALLT